MRVVLVLLSAGVDGILENEEAVLRTDSEIDIEKVDPEATGVVGF